MTMGGCSPFNKQPKEERLKPPDTPDEIQVGIPSQVGFDSVRLQALLDSVEVDPHRDLNSILVAQNGTLVLEAYFNGRR
jgi:hypothetical protein